MLRSESVYVSSVHHEIMSITYCASYLYDWSGTTHKSADPLSGQPVNIPRGLGFRAIAGSYFAVPEKRITNGYKVKYLKAFTTTHTYETGFMHLFH